LLYRGVVLVSFATPLIMGDMMSKPKSKRIYRYYNDILVDVTTDTYLKSLDENKAITIITELEKHGTYRHGEVFYSLKSINNNINDTNV
jgi:hypothetical protein